MGAVEWKRVLELAAGNPEILMALLYVIGGVFALVALVAGIAWTIRGAVASGQIAALKERLELAGEQLQDASQKLAMARDEQAKLAQSIGTPELSAPANKAVLLGRLLAEATWSTNAASHTLTVRDVSGKIK